MSQLIDFLLPLVRSVAVNLAGTPLADDAEADVRSVEAIAARHAQSLESELTAWLATRLHPAAADPAQPTA